MHFRLRQAPVQRRSARQAGTGAAPGAASRPGAAAPSSTIDDNAPSLRDSLGPVLQRLEAHGVDDLRVEWWCGTVLPANWKIAMEAFQEGYHVMKTHPQLPDSDGRDVQQRSTGRATPARAAALVQQLDVKGATSRAGGRSADQALWSGSARAWPGCASKKEVDIAKSLRDADLPEDPDVAMMVWLAMVQDKISQELQSPRRERARSQRGLRIRSGACGRIPVPALFSAALHDQLRQLPDPPAGAGELPVRDLVADPLSQGRGAGAADAQPTMLPYDSQDFPMIPRQDYSNIPIQQKGTAFARFRIHAAIEGSRRADQQLPPHYRRLHRRAPGRTKLAAANQMLGGNFDGKDSTSLGL